MSTATGPSWRPESSSGHEVRDHDGATTAENLSGADAASVEYTNGPPLPSLSQWFAQGTDAEVTSLAPVVAVSSPVAAPSLPVSEDRWQPPGLATPPESTVPGDTFGVFAGATPKPLASRVESLRHPLNRVKKGHLAILGVALLAGVIAVGSLALRQQSVAKQWQLRDHQELQRNQALAAGLSASQSHVGTLNTQITTLQNQLSAVANAKEQALDQNTVLSKAVTAASAVANQLSTCVNDTNTVINDIDESLSTGTVVSTLQSDAGVAQQVCSSAQSANNGLQQSLSGG